MGAGGAWFILRSCISWLTDFSALRSLGLSERSPFLLTDDDGDNDG